MRDGFLVIEDVLGDAEIDRYRAAIDRVANAHPGYDPAKHFAPQNAVERDPDLVDLIDRETHIGYAYDLYGELTKIHLSQVMRRPRGGWYNFWHPDGARGLPYGVFGNHLPFQLKVGYWLTDHLEAGMGNLVVMPGSHRWQHFEGYDTHESIPGEVVMRLKKGSMTLLHCGCWHRVETNDSDVVRENIYVTYSPAWLVPEDRYTNDPDWLAGLTRERRILMRSYDHPYTNAKPPPEDFPLYLDRESGEDRDPGVYREHVELHRRKRMTWVEKHEGRRPT